METFPKLVDGKKILSYEFMKMIKKKLVLACLIVFSDYFLDYSKTIWTF